MSKTVAVLGASPNEERYANRAMRMLLHHGYTVIPVNPACTEVLGHPCVRSLSEVSGPIDTLTVYVGPVRSEALIPEIIAAHPRRIVLNPGTESAPLANAAREAGIEVVEDCTLVMLDHGTF